jgi:N-acetylmuramic acid 6-phosphate etherase
LRLRAPGFSVSMLENLLTEQRNPASSEIDVVPTADLLRIINAEDRSVPEKVAAAIGPIAAAVDAIAGTLSRGGRLFYIGAGTSGRLGVLDASECPPTYSVPYDLVQGIMAGGMAALSQATEASEDDPALGERDLLDRGFRSSDVLVGIAASGRTPYVIGAIRKARLLGALTVGISCVPNAELSREVDHPIEAPVGPEVITGSTRMKAGTATKLILNMISTGVMVQLGHVYGNLMVNVQPKNRKLVDRAVRIISQASGVDTVTANKLLAETGSVKTSIVMAIRGVDRSQAERLLADAGNRIRQALQS